MTNFKRLLFNQNQKKNFSVDIQILKYVINRQSRLEPFVR